MEWSVSGNALKTFARSVTCLARIGNELTLQASPSQLALHTLNSSRSAYQSIILKPSFFDTFTITGTTQVQCSVLLKAVCSVLRTPLTTIDHLTVILPHPDASKVQWTLNCHNGMKKSYWITCNVETDVQHLSLDKTKLPSNFVVRPRDLNRLLANFQSTLQEITVIATDPTSLPSDASAAEQVGGKAVELRSYIDPTKENDSSLYTQLWIDPSEEFVQYTHTGDPVDVTFGVKELKVRSKLESIDGIVPRTHGFMISSMGMRNVWLSTEHQVILWCNQLVVEVSHTLLSLVNQDVGHPISDSSKRISILTKMLHSGMTGSLTRQSDLLHQSAHLSLQKERKSSGSKTKRFTPCPTKIRWSVEGLEKDLYIKTPTVTILAMDGRRRWLDIKELGSNGRNNFVLVTNLLPCYGVKLHLWPENRTSASNLPHSKRVVDVTSWIAQIPSGPAPRQIEPGSQTEQPPPSAVFWLDPEDMDGFRFLTISVAPSPTVSGRPPPAASMAVGQFFNPEEGRKEFSPLSLLFSMYSREDMLIKEDHPILMNITFGISLGLLPSTVSLETTGCGIKRSGLPVEEVGEIDSGKLCKLRCFPPVALAWDATSGLHIFPNLHSRTLEVDSSPAIWSSTQGSERTTVLLLVDPHCSYKTSAAVSITAAGRRFMLLYHSQIIGFSFAVVFFALMRQANAWELDLPFPSLLSAVESNLRMPLPFLLLAISPFLIALFYSCLSPKPFPSIGIFFVVSMICYLIANGTIIILILTTQILSNVVARVHVFFKTRWKWWILDLQTSFYLFKIMRVVNAHPSLATSLLAVALVCSVHPALGLLVVLFSHVLCCHHALCNFFTASSKARSEDLFCFGNDKKSSNDEFEEGLPVDENSSGTPDSTRSYGDTQLEIFHHRHGLLILHLLSLLMFLPSLVAWLERLSMGHNFPWLLDSILCMGIILHGICDSKPEFNIFFQIPGMRGYEIRQGFVYLIAGYCCYLSGLDLSPYKAFYAMAAVGVVSLVFRIMERRNRRSGEPYYSSRKHSHRH